jgi:hypothetical protein
MRECLPDEEMKDGDETTTGGRASVDRVRAQAASQTIALTFWREGRGDTLTSYFLLQRVVVLGRIFIAYYPC